MLILSIVNEGLGKVNSRNESKQRNRFGGESGNPNTTTMETITLSHDNFEIQVIMPPK